MIKHFNSVSVWVVASILSYHNPETRARAIIQFALLAEVYKHCYGYGYGYDYCYDYCFCYSCGHGNDYGYGYGWNKNINFNKYIRGWYMSSIQLT